MNTQILQRPVTHCKSGQSHVAAIPTSSASHNHRVQPRSDPTVCELVLCRWHMGKGLAQEGWLGGSQCSLK